MTTFSENFASRRAKNIRALGPASSDLDIGASGQRYRTVRKGAGPTIYTIGYERRDGEDLISNLQDADITTVIDVRDKPVSRKPDFRESALRAMCTEARITYESWKNLGSTEEQREELKSSGDFCQFSKQFRKYAKREMSDAIELLAKRLASRRSVCALLCYERRHDECHRSIVAELLADRVDATIVAIS